MFGMAVKATWLKLENIPRLLTTKSQPHISSKTSWTPKHSNLCEEGADHSFLELLSKSLAFKMSLYHPFQLVGSVTS